MKLYVLLMIVNQCMQNKPFCFIKHDIDFVYFDMAKRTEFIKQKPSPDTGMISHEMDEM